MWKIISYYTPNYKEIAEKYLIPSVQKLNLPNHIMEVPSLGSWKNNTDYKPLFIKECLNKFKENLIWTDCDSTINSYPIYFDQLNNSSIDFAYHLLSWELQYGRPQDKNKFEFLSGTLFFRNNEIIKQLVDKWIEYSKKIQPDQKSLKEAVKNCDILTYDKIAVLPREYCFDNKTEVLTDQGWKLFKDLDKTEKVATLNLKTDMVEYQLPMAYYSNNYHKKMIKIKTTKIDLLITPDHNIFIKNKSNKIKIVKANHYNLNTGGLQFKRKFNYLQDKEIKWFVLPKLFYKAKNWVKENKFNSYLRIIPEKKIPMDDWLKFLGWYLSEGFCFNTKGNNYKIVICQSYSKNKNYCKEIEKILNKCDIKFSKYMIRNVLHFYIQNKQLYEYLKQFGKSSNKFIPKEILNLSNKQMKILFYTLMKGDGHKRNKKNTFTYVTKSKQLADDVQELGLKIGFTPSIYKSKYSIYYLNITRDDWSYSTKRMEQKYNGKIFCIEVPNKIIFVRRNGKGIWSGNCYISSIPNGLLPAQPIENAIISHYQASRKKKYENR